MLGIPPSSSIAAMMISRTTPMLLAIACCALPAAAEPVPGLWERRFTAFMSDPVSGAEKPWAEPADTRCLSESELRKLPFLTASSSKASYEADGGYCTVSDDTRTGQTAAWRLLCKEKDGSRVEMQMSTEVSQGVIASTTRTAAQDKASGASGVRAEIRMKRLGNCDGGAVAKP